MAIINTPPQSPVDLLQTERGIPRLVNVTEGWRNFFQAVFTICSAMTQSGTTAQRPATLLWTGRMYFDTTIGKPIWYEGPGWVDATGAPA